MGQKALLKKLCTIPWDKKLCNTFSVKSKKTFRQIDWKYTNFCRFAKKSSNWQNISWNWRRHFLDFTKIFLTWKGWVSPRTAILYNLFSWASPSGRRSLHGFLTIDDWWYCTCCYFRRNSKPSLHFTVTLSYFFKVIVVVMILCCGRAFNWLSTFVSADRKSATKTIFNVSGQIFCHLKYKSKKFNNLQRLENIVCWSYSG